MPWFGAFILPGEKQRNIGGSERVLLFKYTCYDTNTILIALVYRVDVVHH